MKILYDYQIFTSQKYGGISRYFVEIISHLSNDISYEIPVLYSDNVYLRKQLEFDYLKPVYNPIDQFLFGWKFRGKHILFQWFKKYFPSHYVDCYTLNKAMNIESIKAQDFDIFHPTYYDDYFLEYLGNKPFVLTVHDMIHELYPELLNDSCLSVRKKRLVERAAHIIAVSENTKKDIMDIFCIPEEKISVIYHASSMTKIADGSFQLPEKYFLFVGARRGYKNFLFFIRALAPILEHEKDVAVVCTGGSFSKEELDVLDSLNIREHFISTFVEEDEMFELYNRAIALVFPSYYEGFGIPILEAFESSCPVLLSDASCFPEIAQEAAIFFPPKDIKQIQFCLEEILHNTALKQTLINRGLERIKNFSWEKSAQQTYEVYQRVLKN